MPTPIELVGGLAAAIGSDFRQSHNQLVFVEYGGKLSTFDLFPNATIVSQGTVVLKGTYLFDLDAGVESVTGPIVGTTWDLFWDQQTTVIRSMNPYDGAKIVNLGVVPFASVTASSLQSLTYGTTPIPANADPTNKLVPGDVFAVHTNAGNFAKVLVVAYGYDLQIQWVTYKLAQAYNVIGTGYSLPEDIEVAADDTHAYVLEESGDLVKIALTSANRSAATVIATGLVNPQQLALDEAHNNAYVVEFSPAGTGNLYRFALTPSSPKHSVLNTLHGATGLVLSADLQYAYVAEQNAGGTVGTGTISRITLADGTRKLVASNLIAPFHLTWADAGQSALFIAERDPANRISRIDLTATPATSTVVVTGLAFRPSSVALANPSQLLVCCNSDLQSVALAPFLASGPLLMGIGFVPFDKVQPTGLADTTVDPTYFYQVKNVPFGGTLPLMVNHQLAANDGAAFYRVLVYKDAALTTLELIDTAPITDEHWNGTQYTAVTTPTTVINGKPGYLPVHPVSELFLWYNPSLGAFLDSTVLPNGKNTIVLEFITATGAAVATTPALTILVDNNPCVAGISQPTLNGNPANPTCGILKYTGFNALPVVMAFTGSHPNNFANYSFTLIKGVATLTPPSISGPVSTLVSPISETAATLLGNCSVAGFAEYVYVAATTQNGWGSQTQYDASAAIAFVLAP
ncbi:YncE family protein [Granulicella arctica]|uniref:YncE family protein n=1 Tax=Granulicella arctica TaxID=940613 RepID=UPI0021E04AAC|nr:hypothetical protein [Granulicella arctica]